MFLQLSVSADQVVRRTVVGERGFRLGFEFRDDALGQDFAELDAPLVEGVDLPDGALGEDRMFVKSDELAESFRRQLGGQDGVRRAVALEDAVGDEPVWRSLGFDLLRSLSERQRLGLGEDVCQKHVMLAAEGIERLHEGDEVTRDEPRSLVNELVEGVLAIGSWFAPVDRTRGIGDICSVAGTCFPLLSIVNCWRYAGKRFKYCSYGRTATVWAPKKSLYQRPRRPRRTGRLRSNGAVRKCSSIWWKPSSMALKLSAPMASMVERPIAESME